MINTKPTNCLSDDHHQSGCQTLNNSNIPRVKLKYAHAGGYNPPIIVVHGNLVKELPDSYKRYLMNYYRKSLEIMGTPIQIRFQSSENPYEMKSDKMTLSQERKRKKLMSMMQNRKKK